jgi:hypothetical protein
MHIRPRPEVYPEGPIPPSAVLDDSD